MVAKSEQKKRLIRKRIDGLSQDKRQLLEQLLHSERSREGKIARTAPLSSAQQRLWFLDQLTPKSPFYTVDIGYRINSPLNVDAMHRALNEMVKRHEVLRTIFAARDGQPLQIILASMYLELPIIDLTDVPTLEAEEEIIRLATEESRQPFDLTCEPLLRVKLLRVAKEEYVFLLTMHHIITDGWSMRIFFQELTDLYSAFCAGERPSLPEMPIQFADYAEWERQHLQEEAVREELEYWKRRLTDLPTLALPADHPRPPVASYRGARRAVSISQRMMRSLETFSRREQTTLHVTLLAAFQALLHRYTGQNEIVLGTPAAGRNWTHTESLIGCFINMLVMRTDLSGNPSFRSAMARVREVVIEALAHQNVPLEKIIEELKVPRDLSRNPLFQVTFQMFQTPGPMGPASRPVVSQKGTAQVDIAIDLFQTSEGITGTLEYNTDLFELDTIDRLVRHFQVLLEGILDDPERRLSELPLIPHNERKQMLIDWNATVATIPQHCVHDLISAQANRTPFAEAVLFENQYLTYQDLESKTNQIANYLRHLGIGRGLLVGLYLRRSVELPIGMLGILKTGAGYVPLDPSYPRERLEFFLADATPALLLTQHDLVDRIPSQSIPIICLDSDWGKLSNYSDQQIDSGTTLEDLAYVIYTSGSTGLPKGVMVPHRALLNHMIWWQSHFPLRSNDRMLHKCSVSFDVAALEILAPLMSGASLVVARPEEHADVVYLAKLIRNANVTAIDVVPSQLKMLLDEPSFQECHSLTRITCGGEIMSVDLMQRVLSETSAELYNLYGPSESTISATCWTCRPGDELNSVPIGRPIANTQIYILDAYDRPVPIGVPGELCIGGIGLAMGYLGQPQLTAEKFVRNPFDSHPLARMYKTGDRARYRANGEIEFLGRLDDQVKVRGHRIELGEIEAALAQHPSVQSCALAVQADQHDDASLVAYVVPKSEPELWPSVGEYFLYDPLLYRAMTNDLYRNGKYRAAINQIVNGKTVVDVGTGADALLARFCVEAGARQVYAIEMMDESFQSACELIQRLGLTDKITLIHGDARSAEIPEQVDVCVSELLGMIASSEGAPMILNQARRFLKSEGVMIPSLSATKIAAVSLPNSLSSAPAFSKMGLPYVERIFQSVGYSFDVRVCINNFPKSHIISTEDLFEVLDFQHELPQEFRRDIQLTIMKDGPIDGFLLWLYVETMPGDSIDVLNDKCHWLPVFFPVFSPGIQVKVGDCIHATCVGTLAANGFTPDYRLSGWLKRSAGDIQFDYQSPHSKPIYCSNEFYSALFKEDYVSYAEASTDLDPHGLRAYLNRVLPDYMMPARFVMLPALPRLASGKLDRKKLPMKRQEFRILHEPQLASPTDMERAIIRIWLEFLEVESISTHDNFFDLGGHSLMMVRIQSRVKQLLKRELSIIDMFRYPTIRSLAKFLNQQ